MNERKEVENHTIASLPPPVRSSSEQRPKPPHVPTRGVSHRRLMLTKPDDVLQVLQDAINDVRKAKDKDTIVLAAARCKAVSFACSVWISVFDKYTLFELSKKHEEQLQLLMARQQNGSTTTPHRFGSA